MTLKAKSGIREEAEKGLCEMLADEIAADRPEKAGYNTTKSKGSK